MTISTAVRCWSGELWLHGAGVPSSQNRYPMSKVSSSDQEEIPQVQGKEQQLCFAGAAVKRYPTFKVRETQVRW